MWHNPACPDRTDDLEEDRKTENALDEEPEPFRRWGFACACTRQGLTCSAFERRQNRRSRPNAQRSPHRSVPCLRRMSKPATGYLVIQLPIGWVGDSGMWRTRVLGIKAAQIDNPGVVP